MPITEEIFLPLSELPAAADADADALTALALARAAQQAGLLPERPGPPRGRVLRRALDARKGFPIGYRMTVEVWRQDEPAPTTPPPRPPPPARPGLRVLIAGSGPAGTFCALRLSQAGAQVTVLEQGKEVQPRRRDLALLTRGTLVPSSNYCFGEGGAGTFSDGKLYTRTKDRAAVAAVLQALVDHGADPAIAVESRPHIGSNRLPKVLTALREDLLRRGVAYLFEESLAELLLDRHRPGRLQGVRCASGREVLADALVLAVGHSARPVYEMLRRHGVPLEPRPFAVGVRVEHPQPLIDRIQYGHAAGHPALPAAFYQVAGTFCGRGVYSFCMCPGGWVVPSSTEPARLCTNGMSLSRRDSPLANAALVVTVEPRDYSHGSPGADAADPLAGVRFQRLLEERAYAAGGGGFVAPAQRLQDLCAGRRGDDLVRSTYRPGIAPADFRAFLPPFLLEPLLQAAQRFQRLLPGFLSREAQLVGIETRTSAPLRVLRDRSLHSPALPGLYPCGEGAGYAGGIVSAALDGLRVADAILGIIGP